MAFLEVKNLCFTYPDCCSPALKDISFKVEEGEILLVCGLSGCGKSTLLRCLKPSLTPFSRESSGELSFSGKPLGELSKKQQAADIGFVMQRPDDQIVTHKVWHEMSFTMENLGWDKEVMRLKAGEMCSYFGLNGIYESDVNSLSGGQKQLVNLASVLAADPKLIILDEPCAQLDPIASGEFLSVIKRINRELGITIIISEHNLEETLSFSDKLLVLEEGKQVFFGEIKEGIEKVRRDRPRLFKSMPQGVKLYSRLDGGSDYPLNVCRSRSFLKSYGEERNLLPLKNTAKQEKFPDNKRDRERKAAGEKAVSCRGLWFKYDKKGKDILKNLSFEVYCGEVFSILGANGSGKSTLLKCLCGIEKPYRGKIDLTKGKTGRKTAYLPQDPTLLFLKETVDDELREAAQGLKLNVSKAEKDRISEKIRETAEFFELEKLLHMHPYDISGGEQQRTALAKLLLKEQDIILLDEPTKGLDFSFKEKLRLTIKRLSEMGKAVILVSHDTDFAADCSDRCAMLFNGTILSQGRPREFFGKNRFYTTCISRIAAGIIPGAVYPGDIYSALGVEKDEE